MRVLAFCLLCLTAPCFAAEDRWPALYDVTGVDAGDVLNVRTLPNASAPIVGSLAPDATQIEVVRVNDTATWGLINIGETSGWASLRFLEWQTGQWDPTLPPVKQCFGTEPFWSLDLAGEVPTYSEPEGEISFLIDAEIPSANRTDRLAVRLSGDAETALLVVSRGYCDDGMSDQEYGLQGDLIRETPDGTVLLSGCCSLAGR